MSVAAEVKAARAKALAPSPSAAKAQPEPRPKKERQPGNIITRYIQRRRMAGPDWSRAGFDAALIKWFDKAGAYDWRDPDDLCEFIENGMSTDLRTSEITIEYVARHRTAGRPMMKVSVGDKHLEWLDCSTTVAPIQVK